MIEVDDDVAFDVRYGRVFESARLGSLGVGPYPLVDENGELLAIYEKHRGSTVKPTVVLVEPPPKSESPTPVSPEPPESATP